MEIASGTVVWVRAGDVGQSEIVPALPPATPDDLGRIITLPGGAGVMDVAYICLKSASDVYGWRQFAVGGP